MIRAWTFVTNLARGLARLAEAEPPMKATVTANKTKQRRRALRKLGGACACCGLGMDFMRVLTFHHVNENGDIHRRALADVGLCFNQYVIVAERPGEGLFALEILCRNCHEMTHAQGFCPHRSARAALQD
jgi:hypothetical protein